MEKRINRRIDEHSIEFKTKIKEWIKTENVEIQYDGESRMNEFLELIFEHPPLVLSKEDFLKRKRVKNVVPHNDRCTAKRANGEQCTRRKKDKGCFCGTHAKGTPHGQVQEDNNAEVNIKKIQVWVEEINGIQQYIDSNNNVYKQEEIIANKTNPSIIAKWELDQNGAYIIPEFNNLT